jgi:hypothetical protein
MATLAKEGVALMEECKHEILIWHSPEVFSCKACNKAMFIDITRGEQGA